MRTKKLHVCVLERKLEDKLRHLLDETKEIKHVLDERMKDSKGNSNRKSVIYTFK